MSGFCARRGACPWHPFEIESEEREATEQEDAPALCPCGERPATIGGYCDECRADARDVGEP